MLPVLLLAGPGPAFRTDPSQLVLRAAEIRGTSVESEDVEP